MVTEHTVCALLEDHPLHRHYRIVCEYRGNQQWSVRHGNTSYIGADGEATDEPVLMGEAEALRIAEEVAPLVKAWTVKGVMTAAEAVEAGLR